MHIKILGDDSRSIYLIQDLTRNKLNYGIITKYYTRPLIWHYAGYVNVNKDLWRLHQDSPAFAWPITFEGIESTLLEIPKTFSHNVPVDILNYWIGIDYMGAAIQPTEDEVAQLLSRISCSYNDITKNSII